MTYFWNVPKVDEFASDPTRTDFRSRHIDESKPCEPELEVEQAVNGTGQRVYQPLSSDYGTYTTVKARFWPWLSGEST